MAATTVTPAPGAASVRPTDRTRVNDPQPAATGASTRTNKATGWWQGLLAVILLAGIGALIFALTRPVEPTDTTPSEVVVTETVTPTDTVVVETTTTVVQPLPQEEL